MENIHGVLFCSQLSLAGTSVRAGEASHGVAVGRGRTGTSPGPPAPSTAGFTVRGGDQQAERGAELLPSMRRTGSPALGSSRCSQAHGKLLTNRSSSQRTPRVSAAGKGFAAPRAVAMLEIHREQCLALHSRARGGGDYAELLTNACSPRLL